MPMCLPYQTQVRTYLPERELLLIPCLLTIKGVGDARGARFGGPSLVALVLSQMRRDQGYSLRNEYVVFGPQPVGWFSTKSPQQMYGETLPLTRCEKNQWPRNYLPTWPEASCFEEIDDACLEERLKQEFQISSRTLRNQISDWCASVEQDYDGCYDGWIPKRIEKMSVGHL